MGNNRSKVPDLEKLVKGGRKKFVRYEEGAMLYSMGVLCGLREGPQKKLPNAS